MTARRNLVQVGRCDRSLFVSLFHQLHDFLRVSDCAFTELVDVNASRDVLPDVEILLFGFDQIVYRFVIDLDVTAANFDFLVFRVREDLTDRKRNKAQLLVVVPFHGMSFAGARLTVSENSLVDAVHGGQNNAFDRGRKDLSCVA